MKNINSISSEIRDNLLNLNIGKYSQVDLPLIQPIGTINNIYESNGVKMDSIIPNGLLDYINRNDFKKTGEFEENSNITYFEDKNINPIDIVYTNIPSKYSYIEEKKYYKDENINNSTFNINNTNEFIDLGYNSVKQNRYSSVNDETYNEPKDKNWAKMAVDATLGYILGDSIGLSQTNEGFQLVSSSLESSISLPIRLASAAIEEDSDLGKIGLRSLGLSLSNSVIQKTRIINEVNSFFEKPIGFYDAVDVLDLDKIGINLPSWLSNFSQKTLPIYLYTEVKSADIKDFSWINDSKVTKKINNEKGYTVTEKHKDSVVNESGSIETISSFNLPPQSLLAKTQRLFNNNKIQTLVSKIGTEKVDGDTSITNQNPLSRGRALKSKNVDSFCRVWTVTNEYNKISSLIRPFSDESKNTLKSNLRKVRPNSESTSSLDRYGVLQDNGFVKISPYKNDSFGKLDIKKYMFSIENLAWKDSIDSLIEDTSQDGPNGGRIMWFPPYDITFNETTSVSWNSDVFIGRGEPIYTYTNTERNGTLSFKVIVDHPSIINYYKQTNDSSGQSLISEDDYLRFFAGEDVVKLNEETIQNEIVNKIQEETNTTINTEFGFKVYFPDNYPQSSSTNDTLSYLYNGIINSGEYDGSYYIEESTNIQNMYTFKEATEYVKLNNQYTEETEDKTKMNIRSEYIKKYINIKSHEEELKIKEMNCEVSGTAENINVYNEYKALYNVELSEFTIIESEYNKTYPNGWDDNIEIINSDDSSINNSGLQESTTNLRGKFNKFNDVLKKLQDKSNNILENLIISNEGFVESKIEYDNIFNNEFTPSLNILTEELTKYDDRSLSLTKSNNELYQALLDTDKIIITSSFTSSETENLANERAEIIKGWLSEYNLKATYEVRNLSITTNDPDSIEAKKNRYVEVKLVVKPTVEKIVSTSDKVVTNISGDESQTTKRIKKSFYNYYKTNNPYNKSNDESMFFEKLEKNSDNVIFNKLSEKIKYFSPAFHSMTPEGFNSRLTFLHQCTRQGNTHEQSGDNKNKTANNMSFGRPPICVLRIGDFYNTKIVIESLNIDFDPLIWDLNEEGIGVQPMIANVTLNFKFIGGSDLTGPIARLQNAVTFNFFANAGVYDDRNDRIIKREYDSNNKIKETYDTLYNPGIYDK